MTLGAFSALAPIYVAIDPSLALGRIVPCTVRVNHFNHRNQDVRCVLHFVQQSRIDARKSFFSNRVLQSWSSSIGL